MGVRASCGRLVQDTFRTEEQTCAPCSHFRINTTLLTGGKAICRKYGVRGTSCPTAGYTRHATFCGTIDRNIQRFRTVTVINKDILCPGATRRGRYASLYDPYKVYERIVQRFYPKSFRVMLTESRRSCRMRALRRLLPLNFKPRGLGGRKKRWVVSEQLGHIFMVMLSSVKVKTVTSTTHFKSRNTSALKRVSRAIRRFCVPGLTSLKLTGLGSLGRMRPRRRPLKCCTTLGRGDGKGSAVAKR